MKIIHGVIICLLIMILCATTSVVNESMAGMDPGSEKLPYAPEISTSAEAQGVKSMGLSLRDFVRLVREKNEQILFQDSQWAISLEAVKSAKAIFEPAFVGAYQYQDDKHRNTLQEMINQGFVLEYWERSKNYQAAIEGLIPTGARLRLGYTLYDFTNSIDNRYGLERESKTLFGASISQPLLKGAGFNATSAGIQVANAEADIALQSYREQMMRVISEAIAAYWDLYLAYRRYELRKESERNVAEILRDNLIRARTGKIAETEVMEAKAGLALRKSLVSEARDAIASSMNNVRTFFSLSAAERKLEIEPTDRPEVEEIKPDYVDSLARAFKLRPEYLSSLRKMEREDIRMVFAENQRWPQLDLKGSYNLNGLADGSRHSWDDAFSQDYKTWSVGLELRIPLGGDRKSSSELEATKHRKQQALLEMKAIEVALANTMDTAIKSVYNSQEQLRHYTGIVDIKKQLLETEIEKFRAGLSSSRIILEKEEDFNKAREAQIESLVKHKKILLQLNRVEGSLLVKHDLELMR